MLLSNREAVGGDSQLPLEGCLAILSNPWEEWSDHLGCQ